MIANDGSNALGVSLGNGWYAHICVGLKFKIMKMNGTNVPTNVPTNGMLRSERPRIQLFLLNFSFVFDIRYSQPRVAAHTKVMPTTHLVPDLIGPRLKLA